MFYPQLIATIGTLNYQDIPAVRKPVLQPLVDFIVSKTASQIPVRLNFICTHNSRRSHLCQIWAQTAAAYFNVGSVCCYSGGTEATALFPAIAETLKQHGFAVKPICEGANPVYAVKYGQDELPIAAFSKLFDDAFNPRSNFAAIMTCSEADSGCPYISGAEARVAIPFLDPKEHDNTPFQTEKYRERSLQIASEMFYVFSKINEQI